MTDHPPPGYDFDLPMKSVPSEFLVRAFGVDYVKCTDADGGELYITRYGWPIARNLLPDVWYRDGRFHKVGQRLTRGTGTVYRLRLSEPGESRVELVVKYSRFAEHVPLFMPVSLPDDLTGYLAASAKFNSPFEEFGLIEDLRMGRYGPSGLRILTKRPLAIYCTPSHHPLWQLGRTPGRFSEYEYALNADQVGVVEDERVYLEIGRQYILLFGWVRGHDAEDLHTAGLLNTDELEKLTLRVNHELAQKGFRILDNKPRHFILRRKPDGSLLHRHGELVYVQVDFELLQRTQEYLDYMEDAGWII